MKPTPLCPALAILSVLAGHLPGQTHTHGSMVGSLQPTSAVVWTRASGPALVSALVNNRPTPAGAVETAALPVVAAEDYTARILLTGLRPGTRYYYATRLANPTFPSNSRIGAWGEFTTPPSGGAAKVSFLASADVANTTEFGIFDSMRNHQAAFYLSLGDMPYADPAQTQADYWNRHKDARTPAPWLRFVEQFPVEAVWDDHEVINDWDKTSDPTLVRFGKKACFDYLPLPQGSTEIYRSIPWGDAVELFLLDLRSHRDANAGLSGPGKTMLGSTQKAWLKNQLLASTAKFKLICSSVAVRFGNMSADTWAGFTHEREEILDFVAQNGIANVLIISGDSHLASVHHYRSGMREYQCGPLASAVRPQVPAGPEVRYRASVRNFMLVTADSTATPATLKVEFFDANDQLLYTETVAEVQNAQVTVQTDLPGGGHWLAGPHYFRDRGITTRPQVPPGLYHVGFDPDPAEPFRPTDLQLNVPPGAVVAVSGRYRELPGGTVLFADSFDGPLSGYTVFDEPGSTNGPSAWHTGGGELLQVNRVDGPTGSHDSDRPGTTLTTGDPNWTDYTVAVRARSHDHGRIGVMFRYQDKDNFYRFVMDEERPLQRLEKKVQGVFTTLAEVQIPYVAHNEYDIECSAVGSRLRVVIDEQSMFDVTDTALTAGKVGLYLWNNRLTRFEDLSVTAGHAPGPTARDVFTDDFEDGTLRGWTIVDHAVRSGTSQWNEILGVLFQFSDIGDVVSDPLARPGTVCLVSGPVPDDVQFTVSMLNFDDDGMGLVFRYVDADNHYRFTWNRELRLRQLEKVSAGTWSVLWQDDRDFDMGKWYRVRVLAEGPRLRLYVDGELLADVTDATHRSGTVGTYSWRSRPVMFDRAIVQRPQSELPVLAAVTEGLRTTLVGRAPLDGGEVYGLALSLARSPGIPLAWLNPADPRILELFPDSLFRYSLLPNPVWSGFAGKLDLQGRLPPARINWPNLPALRGTKVYASGWTGDISRMPIRNVFPTLVVIYP